MSEEHSLDYDLETFETLLNQAVQLVIERYSNLDDAPAYAGLSPAEVESWFDEEMPGVGMDSKLLLEEVRNRVMETATLNIGPHHHAYVNTCGNHVSIIAELLAAAVNQNLGKWHLSPAMSEIEKRIIQWTGELIAYSGQCAGVLTSGGSAANLAGLTMARNIMFEKEAVREKGLHALPPLVVYASAEVHGCMDKSVELLGIGSNNLRKIPVDDQQKIDLGKLRDAINRDIEAGLRPFCLVGNAGTVNSGAIDPLDELEKIARAHGMWFHVDGAYGGLAAMLDSLRDRYRGLEKADSIAIDFHKWFYQPFEAGCVLVRQWSDMERSYYKSASYLSTDDQSDQRFDFNKYNFQLSRNARALKIWMSYKAYGTERIKQAVAKDIDLTNYLDEMIRESGDFELCSPASLSICCFRYLGSLPASSTAEVDKLNSDIIPALESDGRVFITGTLLNGRPVIRACQINHRMQKHDMNFLVQVIREVGESIAVKSN